MSDNKPLMCPICGKEQMRCRECKDIYITCSNCSSSLKITKDNKGNVSISVRGT